MQFTDEFRALQKSVQSAGMPWLCSPKQAGVLAALLGPEFDTREERLIFLGMIVGRSVDTSGEVTSGEASVLISYFKDPSAWIISDQGAELIDAVLQRSADTTA